MQAPRRTHLLLYAIIFIEGYVVLASELLAMRLLIPYVGSGTEIIAIVISAVLMPLAVGYHVGATRYRKLAEQARAQREPIKSVRSILLRNVLTALGILGIGLSYVFIEVFFNILQQMEMPRLWQATMYAVIFLVYPVFLLAQTVPLISHYFGSKALSEHTGRVLFLSTAGSFVGSVISTLIFMNVIGVHGTTMLTMCMLALVGLMLMRRLFQYELLLIGLLLAVVMGANAPSLLALDGVKSHNGYNTISVHEVAGEKDAKILRMNGAYSSKVTPNPKDRFGYIDYIDRIFIQTLPKSAPRNVLIIGAGGFTLGLNNRIHQFDYVDIDPALKAVAQTHFIGKELEPNKRFIPLSARAFLRQNTAQYDLIVIDTYTNAYSVPAECTSVEFMRAVKAALKPGGIVVSNVIATANFDDPFTVRYTNSFAAAFGPHQLQIMGEFNPWVRRNSVTRYSNMLFIFTNSPYVHDRSIYTDNQNTYSLDR